MHAATNIDKRIPVNLETRVTKFSSGAVSVIDKPVSGDRVRDVRAASTASAPDASGWRAPMPYHRHLGYMNPVEHIFVGQVRFANGVVDRDFVAEGPLVPSGTSSAFICDLSRVTVPPALFNKALTKAKLNVLDTQAEIGTLILEIRRTAQHAIDRSFDLLLGVACLTKGDWRQGLKRLGVKHPHIPAGKRKKLTKLSRRIKQGGVALADNVSAMILEMNFAVIPTIGELNALARNLDQLLRRPIRFHVEGKAMETADELRDSSFTPYTAVGLPGNASTKLKVKYKVSTKFGAKYRLDYLLENPLSNNAQALGLTNLPVAVYETIPLSFVVDYGIGIGDWMRTFIDAPGVTFISGTETGWYKATAHSFSGSLTYNTTTSSQKLVVTDGQSHYNGFSRVVLSSVPLNWPDMRSPFTSLKRGINQLSLAVQLALSSEGGKQLYSAEENLARDHRLRRL